MQTFVSKSERQTEQFAEDFAVSLKAGAVVAFEGDLGAGKTAFVRGLARGLNCSNSVSSPTFAIVNEYDGSLPLFHFDMYRIETLGELYSVGFFEYLERGGVCAIEWSENIYSALPDDSIFVVIEKIDENTRKITVREGKE
ncbi:MAG: tRNA (adenosine(37)-N6)-threonylcarbamoyltransferase complex ATPase subunit type 1 TsaE [Oscillospiraceae bacterium]|nr:tRNA (adenosine(37)-N6)-threonylcarbamoyltransferase complex ATPase subunit type 1 TsaE [Oscillospiraceae bacterium]